MIGAHLIQIWWSSCGGRGPWILIRQWQCHWKWGLFQLVNGRNLHQATSFSFIWPRFERRFHLPAVFVVGIDWFFAAVVEAVVGVAAADFVVDAAADAVDYYEDVIAVEDHQTDCRLELAQHLSLVWSVDPSSLVPNSPLRTIGVFWWPLLLPLMKILMAPAHRRMKILRAEQDIRIVDRESALKGISSYNCYYCSSCWLVLSTLID